MNPAGWIVSLGFLQAAVVSVLRPESDKAHLVDRVVPDVPPQPIVPLLPLSVTGL